MKFTLICLLGLMVVGFATAANPRTQEKKIEEGRGCGQNEEDGLGPFVTTFFEIFPLNDALNIFIEYAADDEEVMAVLEYLISDDFIAILEYMNHMEEFIEVLEYFCTELYLDIYYYLNYFGALFGYPVITRPPGAVVPKFAREPGFQGMLNEINAILPHDELMALWEDASVNDPYVILGLAKLQSETFEAVFDRLAAMPEFQDMKLRLEALGFDIEAMIAGWREWLFSNN